MNNPRIPDIIKYIKYEKMDQMKCWQNLVKTLIDLAVLYYHQCYLLLTQQKFAECYTS